MSKSQGREIYDWLTSIGMEKFWTKLYLGDQLVGRVVASTTAEQEDLVSIPRSDKILLGFFH